MDAETAFRFVGNFGRYQLFLSSIFCLTNLVFSLQMVLMVVVGANVTSGEEDNMTTIVTDFKLQSQSWLVDLMQSLFMAGYIVGSLIFGQISDIWGRRPVLLLNGFLAGISSFCSGLTVNWQTFAVTRCFAGMFVGGLSVASYVLLTEYLGRSTWGTVGIVFQMFFSLGICLLAGLGYAAQKWQTVCMISGALGFGVTVLLLIFTPESPRWLYSTGKIEKSEALLRKMAKRNGRDPRSIYLSPVEENQTTHTFIDLFRYKKLLAWFAIICWLWFSNGLIYYGLTLSAGKLTSDLFIGIVLSGAIEIPANILCIFMMNFKWLGRKGSLLLLFGICCLANIITIFVHGNADARLVLGLAGKLVIAGAFNIIYVYSCELFPTPLRTVSLGAATTCARIGAIIAPFVPLMAIGHAFVPYLFYGLAACISFILMIFLPRTLGKPVPQTVDEVVGRTTSYEHLVEESDCGDDLDKRLQGSDIIA